MRFAAYFALTLATLLSVPASSDAGHFHRFHRFHVHGFHPRTRIVGHHFHRHHFRYYRPSFYVPRVYVPRVYSSYYVAPYCYPRTFYYSTYVAPPIYAPASSLGYGLAGVNQILSTQNLLQRYNRTITIPRTTTIQRAPQVPRQVPIEVRNGPSQAARELATKYINYGDRLFAEQRFHEALARYKTAVLAAPALPEAHLRKAHALLTVKQYDLALKSFDRGYQILGEADRDNFQLDDLYRDNRSVKIAHMEQLAKAAMDNPQDAKPLLLLALSLHYDGEVARAQKFFARALAMTTGYDEIAIRFLAPRDGSNAVVAKSAPRIEI